MRRQHLMGGALAAAMLLAAGCPAGPVGPRATSASPRPPAAATATPAPIPTLVRGTTSPRPAPTPAPSRAPAATAAVVTPSPAPSVARLVPDRLATYAGSTIGDAVGPRLDAKFLYPQAVRFHPDGRLFVSDFWDFKAIARDGTVTRFGPPKSRPRDFVFDAAGTIFATDRWDRVIKVTPAGEMTVFAGSADGARGFQDGQGTAALFNKPDGITIDADGNLYVADTANDRIRKITPAGYVSTLAGNGRGLEDGPGTRAKFEEPLDVKMGPDGFLYVADSWRAIRKVSRSGEVSTYCRGREGFVVAPQAIAFDRHGRIFMSSWQQLWVVTGEDEGYLLAGRSPHDVVDGPVATANTLNPRHMAVAPDGTVYFPDVNSNLDGKPSAIRTLTFRAGSAP